MTNKHTDRGYYVINNILVDCEEHLHKFYVYAWKIPYQNVQYFQSRRDTSTVIHLHVHTQSCYVINTIAYIFNILTVLDLPAGHPFTS